MRLLVVESPNKIAKIRSLLPADFKIVASVGHIRDLPVDAEGGIGIDFSDNGITPHYVVTKPEVVRSLQAAAERADAVYLATDPDREGEAIAWHIAACLGARTYHRVAFQSITRAAIDKALAAPRDLDLHLVDAQQARRVLDRVVGWVVSPVLRRNVGSEARSAGRVQSVALRIVAEREQEIAAFSKTEYFLLEADFPGPEAHFTARLSHLGDEELGHRLASATDAQALRDRLAPGPWSVLEAQQATQHKQPPPPFTTATVQQAASVHLHLGPKETMAALQRLFEGGHITYHRTDSVALDPEAIELARAEIRRRLGDDYLPDAPRLFATRNEQAQEAHEAIRPTHPDNGPDAITGSDGRLYRLIWERFIACQMAAAIDETTTYRIVSAAGNEAVFTAKGVVVVFDGWRSLSGGDAAEEHREERTAPLPPHQTGDPLVLLDLRCTQRSTRPPTRYTQASLIKKLEREGVGRPSTYASIMATIITRGYVCEQRRKLHATAVGLKVSAWLCRHFQGDFIEIGYTRALEAALDDICLGRCAWETVVRRAADSVLAFAQRAGLGYNPLAGESRFVSTVVEGITCPRCGAPMRTRSGRFGIFYGCTTYPACTGTRPGPDDRRRDDQAMPKRAGPPAEATIRCPRCDGSMSLVMDGGTPFYACDAYPACTGTRDC